MNQEKEYHIIYDKKNINEQSNGKINHKSRFLSFIYIL